MGRVLTFLGLLVGLLLIAVSAVLYFSSAPVKQIEKVGPDVRTVATASVEQLRKQARLTVLVSGLRADATSTVSRYAMMAEVTDIAGAEARYSLNLAGLRPDAMRLDQSTLTLKLPRSLLTFETSPPQGRRRFDNGSLMLVSSAVVAELAVANRRKLEDELDRQARTLLPLAEQQAVVALTAMLEMPLRAVGSRVRVVVTFG